MVWDPNASFSRRLSESFSGSRASMMMNESFSRLNSSLSSGLMMNGSSSSGGGRTSMRRQDSTTSTASSSSIGDNSTLQFEKEMEVLSYTPGDLESLVMDDDEAFRVLKLSLRQKGCVTNAYLKENVHLFVQHVKEVKERRRLRGNQRAARKAAGTRRSRRRSSCC